MKDVATILKELGFGEASVNGYRNVEYDYTNLVLHFTEKDEMMDVLALVSGN